MLQSALSAVDRLANEPTSTTTAPSAAEENLAAVLKVANSACEHPLALIRIETSMSDWPPPRFPTCTRRGVRRTNLFADVDTEAKNVVALFTLHSAKSSAVPTLSMPPPNGKKHGFTAHSVPAHAHATLLLHCWPYVLCEHVAWLTAVRASDAATIKNSVGVENIVCLIFG